MCRNLVFNDGLNGEQKQSVHQLKHVRENAFLKLGAKRRQTETSPDLNTGWHMTHRSPSYKHLNTTVSLSMLH
jgi:hypothetical protein